MTGSPTSGRGEPCLTSWTRPFAERTAITNSAHARSRARGADTRSSDAPKCRRSVASFGAQTRRGSPSMPWPSLPWSSSAPDPAAPRDLDRGGSGTRTGERHVRDSAGRGGGLDLVVLLEALQSVPEAYAPAEQDRDHHDVHVVDEPGGKEVADHGGTPADADVLAARSLAGRLERLGRRRVDEVVRRAALHLDRRARVMGEDEDRCVERRIGTPPALPLRVLVPSGRTELPGTHDLGADPRSELPREGVVDAAAAAGLADDLAPEPGGEHPLVQPFAGVTERCLVALTLTGAEAVE